ncbi:ligase-associated DNA damage response endonuclease PdeM [Cupriavidus plantarum]|uniref:ligase-associated DNA damage response endonuclease PdeM n=1 Tax=Cupriavidus plantarum TaxID=942865 RepID=UPI000EB41DDC|nr:ligase-associated DNA damage response endonuclease PdeM [Cupriavidus plantarum]RLK45355.1 putative phosphoesterase [Cupriavidus plantarum]
MTETAASTEANLIASGAVAIDAAGETLWLLPDPAIWWPARAMLLVADVHIGKAASFRALGQPVPAGTTASNLARLRSLVMRYRARELVFLGDFLHARAARTAAVLLALQDWRSALPPELRLTLVRGNHDLHAGDPPPALSIDVTTEPHVAGPFALCHTPGASRAGYVLAGHLHPAFHLRGRRSADSVRLPCFVFGPEGAILPAFGAFTGHANVRAEPGTHLYVIGDGRVWPVRQNLPAGPARDM